MQIKERKRWDKLIIASFLAVPILASIISTLHIIHFLDLGNPNWMSVFLSVTFEVGSVASFLALSVLDKVKKGMVMFIFVILFLMQITGNVYFSFEYVNQQLAVTSGWMNTFIELVTPLFAFENQSTYKFVLAMLIGLPVPIVSLAFLKSLVDYLKVDEKDSMATIESIESKHSGLSDGNENGQENLQQDYILKTEKPPVGISEEVFDALSETQPDISVLPVKDEINTGAAEQSSDAPSEEQKRHHSQPEDPAYFQTVQ